MRRGKQVRLAVGLGLVASAVVLLALPSMAAAEQRTFSSGPINQPIPNNAPTGGFSPIGVGKKGPCRT